MKRYEITEIDGYAGWDVPGVGKFSTAAEAMQAVKNAAAVKPGIAIITWNYKTALMKSVVKALCIT